MKKKYEEKITRENSAKIKPFRRRNLRLKKENKCWKSKRKESENESIRNGKWKKAIEREEEKSKVKRKLKRKMKKLNEEEISNPIISYLYWYLSIQWLTIIIITLYSEKLAQKEKAAVAEEEAEMAVWLSLYKLCGLEKAKRRLAGEKPSATEKAPLCLSPVAGLARGGAKPYLQLRLGENMQQLGVKLAAPRHEEERKKSLKAAWKRRLEVARSAAYEKKETRKAKTPH